MRATPPPLVSGCIRGELCSEAIRLGRLLARLMPDDGEVRGLLALMLLHDSRRAARVDEHGRYVPLDEQDRSRWDQGRIREGLRTLETALRLRRPGPYQLQAAIAALHARGDRRRRDRLGADRRAVRDCSAGSRPRPWSSSIARWRSRFASGARAGLELLEPLIAQQALADYQPLHAAHAELLRRAGDRAKCSARLPARDRAERQRGRARRARAAPRRAVSGPARNRLCATGTPRLSGLVSQGL